MKSSKEILKKHNTTYIPIWPIIFFLFVFLHKLYFIATSDLIKNKYEYLYSKIVFVVMIEDLSILFIILTLSIFYASRFKYFIAIILASLNFFYLIDSLILQSLFERFTIANFSKFFKEIGIIITFLTPQRIFYLLVMIAILFILRKKTIKLSLKKSYLFIILVSFSSIPWILSYTRPFDPIYIRTMNFIRINQSELIKKDLDPYLIANIRNSMPSLYEGFLKLSAGADLHPCKIHKNLNIIVLISESLSQIDSMRSGGIFDRLPKIDSIQKEGITLTNVISNGNDTDKALASLLLGVDPLPTKMAPSDMDSLYPARLMKNRNIILTAKKNGYRTFFLTNTPLSFLRTDSWLANIEFDHIIDSKADIFNNYPTFAFDSPSDEALFSQALSLINKIKKQKSPFFLCLMTVSLHKPYTLPKKQYRIGKNPKLNLLNYIDNITFDFYQNLKKIGFFDNGILLIIGDHRRLGPREPEEIQMKGIDSFGRVVCSFIGSGIAKGKIDDTLLNQTDINTILNMILSNCNVDFKKLTLYNKNNLLQINESFATNVLAESFRSILIRAQTKQPLLINLDGNLNIGNIKDPTYRKIVAYIILSSAWLDKKQHSYVNRKLP